MRKLDVSTFGARWVTASFLVLVACGASDNGAGGDDGTGGSGDDGGTGSGGDDGAGTDTGDGGGGTDGTGTTDTGTDGSTDGGDEPPFVCADQCHYVLAGAAAGGDGSDWSTAWSELPDTLDRGHVYIVGAGDYPSYTFDDADAGGETITVWRATSSAHGTDTGWDDAYAAGAARFGPLVFANGGYVFDGARSAGFGARGEFEGTVVDISGDDVVLRNVDIDGAFELSNGQHSAGACTGLSIGGSGVTVERSIVHDVADDGVSASGVQDLRFAANTVHALHACGTDGGCGPCYNGHSDGIELYDVERSEFVGNFVYDVRSTATVFLGNWADSLGNGPSEYCEDLLFANNIFYAPEVGLVAYIQDVAGVRLHHNVFWGVRQGGYGGLSIGPNVTGLQMYNNVILSVNTDHTGGAFDPAEHDSDHNLIGVEIGQWTQGPNDVVAEDPGFVGIPDLNGAPVSEPSPEDFMLAAGSVAIDAGHPGDAAVVLPADDFFGRPRDAMPDLGASEYP